MQWITDNPLASQCCSSNTDICTKYKYQNYTKNANLKDTNTKLQNARTITKPKKYTQDNRSLRTLSPHTQHNELQCIYKYTNIRYTHKIATNQEQFKPMKYLPGQTSLTEHYICKTAYVSLSPCMGYFEHDCKHPQIYDTQTE